MATATMPTTAEIRRARQLAEGAVVIPLACPRCGGRNLDTNEFGELDCLGCGHSASHAKLNKIRRRRIARFIRTGDHG